MICIFILVTIKIGFNSTIFRNLTKLWTNFLTKSLRKNIPSFQYLLIFCSDRTYSRPRGWSLLVSWAILKPVENIGNVVRPSLQNFRDFLRVFSMAHCCIPCKGLLQGFPCCMHRKIKIPKFMHIFEGMRGGGGCSTSPQSCWGIGKFLFCYHAFISWCIFFVCEFCV